jgi:hypothetical protein
MALTVTIGTQVNLAVTGHSASNGANMPANSAVAATSSDTTVATVPTIPNLANDMGSFDIPVTIVASGSATISVLLTTPDGSTFPASDALIVAPAVPGLTHITAELYTPQINPLK